MMRAFLFVLCMCVAVATAQESKPARPTIPEFPQDAEWINTPRPLTLGADLKGHIVLLDFWTYCCINCHHILPDLAELEEEFADIPFAVVGVHSAKFDNENVPANVRNAVRRHRIAHPVVVDTNQMLWQRLGVRAWPTLVLIDAEGRGVGAWSGEGNKERIRTAIKALVEESRAKGVFAKTPFRPTRLPPLVTASGLLFPGKVLAAPDKDRLFVADSGHHRIVETTWPDADGRVKTVRIFGTGAEGRADGPAASASFRFPNGMVLVGDRLFVADTENHLVRSIDLASGRVETFAGTGVMGNDRRGGAKATEQTLNSPWDLAHRDGVLYIAMAGTHQLWSADLASGIVGRWSGSGRENIKDGSAASANYAQPSGLAFLGELLLVADSETSAVRAVMPDGTASTLIGEGLFDFGDVDGPFESAKLQHVLGVAVLDGVPWITDTYNSKLKRLDMKAKAVATVALSGPSGTLTLDEPAGLTAGRGILIIADTNAHRLIRVTPTGEAREIIVEGLSMPTSRPIGR